MINIEWADYYQEFASVLLKYKNDRNTLIQKLLKVYQDIEIKFPRVESGDEIIDIDPFTVYGFFNKGISDANRTAIMKGLADNFGVTANVPTVFDGLPVVNNLNATFYRFKEERGAHDIDMLWEMFEAAITHADHNNSETRTAFITAYDRVKDLKGNRWKLTMALYWIRPYFYINLDSRNRWFIENPENVSEACVACIKSMKGIPDGETYLAVCDTFIGYLKDCGHVYKNLPELSYYAWKISEEVNEENRAAQAKDERENIGKALADDGIHTVHYWMYTVFDDDSWAECQKNGIMVVGMDLIGDYTQYSSKEEMRQALIANYEGDSSRKNQALMTWNFVRTIKVNDVVFAKRANTLVGKGIVTGEYIFDDDRTEYKNVREMKWLQVGEWEHPGNAVAKRLTDITPYTDYIEKLNAVFSAETMEEDEDQPEITYPPYTAEDFLGEVYMEESDYSTLVAILKNKKNIILQGAPGVGKTFAAKRLAYSIMGVKDKDRVMMVQFHQSYSYEDFIMGFRPSATGFELKKGVFYNFCRKAETDSDNDYFFIIDEINRGNLSKIFGELFMLIETDKRGIELQLLYSDERFSVPANVYIIGMMNTADRSLAMLDYALRRRFAFIDLKPGFETEGFRSYRMELENDKFNRLISTVESLNHAISADDSLGDGFCIGHSYFCNLNKENIDEQGLSAIVEFELVPLLKEYWFDEPTKVRDWSNNLRSAIK